MSNFKQSSREEDIQRAVSYLNDSDEPLDSKLGAIEKSAEAGGFSMEEVLSAYAESLARGGVIYPMEESQIRELHRETKRKMDTETLSDLRTVCQPNSLLETADDIISESISIYADDSISSSVQHDRIRSLVNDARRDGISVSNEAVIRSLEEFEAASNARSDSKETSETVDMDIPDADIAAGLDVPEEVFSQEEYIYRVDTDASDSVSEIDWFIGGAKVGDGSTLVHTFEHAGVYTVSVELVNEQGQTDHVTEQVKVQEPSEIQLDIRGDTSLTCGESIRYAAKVQTQNETVQSLDWKLDEKEVASGKVFSHTFDSVEAHTLSLMAEGVSGATAKTSVAVEVNELTAVDVSLTAPETTVVGRQVRIECDISVKNAYLEETTCKIGGTVVEVAERSQFSFNHTFSDPGTHEVTITSITNAGDSDTAGKTIRTYVEPSVNITTQLNEVVQGDVETIEIDADERLDIGWGVNNASLTEVGPESAEVTFNSENADGAEIEVKATNDIGDTGTESLTVQVSEPQLSVLISSPNSVTTGDVTRLSTAGSAVSHAEITRVLWYNGEDTKLGEGETITHEFSSPGEYDISATVHTDRGLEDTSHEIIDVEPKTDVTPVIVTQGGPTTHDTFTITAEKSVAKNTSIDRYSWEIESAGVFSGESVDVSFDAPGEHEVELEVETDAGDTDTESALVSVSQYTAVDAVVTGPEEVAVGDSVSFTANETSPVNTSVSSYDWRLNSQPVGTGEEFKQTFSSPGHYTIELTTTTATGDTDEDTTSIYVERGDSTVTAGISVRGPQRPTVGTPTVITAEDSTVENGSINKFLWEVGGREVAETVHTIQSIAEKYGTSQVTVTVIAEDGTEDTASTEIYTSPRVSNPPYEELSDDDDPTRFDVLNKVTTVYQDEKLTSSDKDRFAAHLLLDAEASEIDVSPSDVTEHVEVIPSVDADTVDISLDDVQAEREDRFNYSGDQVTAETAPAKDAIKQPDNRTTQTTLESESEQETTAETSGEGWDTQTTQDPEKQDEYQVEEVGEEGGISEQSQEDQDQDLELGSVAGASSSDGSQSGWDLGSDNSGESSETGTISSVGQSGNSIDDADAAEFEIGGEAATSESESASIDPEGGEIDDETETPEKDTDEDEDETRTDSDTAQSPTAPETNSHPEVAAEASVSQPTVNGQEAEISTERAATEYKEELLGETTELDEAREDLTEGDKTERISPESYDLGESVLSMPNYSQDLLNFEYIFDKDDELLPDGVNGAGVVVTDDEDYVAIARVEGRDWSIHTESKKQDIINTYKSHVLSSLDNPVQILSVPTRFDIRDHVNRVDGVLDDNSDDESELLMNIGRSVYPNWVEDFMTQNEMNERQFYIVLSISAEQLHNFKTNGQSLTEKLSQTPFIGDMFDRFTSDTGENITPYQCLRELNTRMGRLESNFRRMSVKLDRVSDRNEAMAVLYHYCHNTEPKRDVFPTGPFTSEDGDATIGGVNVQHLIEEHEPARDESQ